MLLLRDRVSRIENVRHPFAFLLAILALIVYPEYQEGHKSPIHDSGNLSASRFWVAYG